MRIVVSGFTPVICKSAFALKYLHVIVLGSKVVNVLMYVLLNDLVETAAAAAAAAARTVAGVTDRLLQSNYRVRYTIRRSICDMIS